MPTASFCCGVKPPTALCSARAGALLFDREPRSTAKHVAPTSWPGACPAHSTTGAADGFVFGEGRRPSVRSRTEEHRQARGANILARPATRGISTGYPAVPVAAARRRWPRSRRRWPSGSDTGGRSASRTRNPWNLDRVPGGSGGGSAAALAAFQAPLAIGIRRSGRRDDSQAPRGLIPAAGPSKHAGMDLVEPGNTCGAIPAKRRSGRRDDSQAPRGLIPAAGPSKHAGMDLVEPGNAFRVGTASRAKGRRAVRFITLSISASATQLSVITVNVNPSANAFRVGTASRAKGRRAVRFITLSISASATQLSVNRQPTKTAYRSAFATVSHRVEPVRQGSAGQPGRWRPTRARVRTGSRQKPPTAQHSRRLAIASSQFGRDLPASRDDGEIDGERCKLVGIGSARSATRRADGARSSR